MYKNFFSTYFACGFLINSYIIALEFPPNFLFGASTSAYQIEGAWDADGKGESIWDRYTHGNSNVINNDNGDAASSNAYYLYRQDIKLFKEIGFDVYRFSISWPRILPTGVRTEINHAGVAYYHNLIDELLENGIEPMVTMYHWDLPQKLQDMGGWMNASVIQYMEDYADLLFCLYGNKVKWWITVNEPLHVVTGYYGKKFLAPALNLGTPSDYIITYNLLRAHGRIFRLYDKKYRSQQNGKISISLVYNFCAPKTSKPEDIEAAERHFQFTVGIFAHPIFSEKGGFPEVVQKVVDANSKREGRKESRLPYFTEEERKELVGSFDYFGFNHYTTSLCSSPSPQNIPNDYKFPFDQDINVTRESDPRWPVSSAHWLKVVPWGFREALIHIKNTYNNPPIFVNENGYCDRGEINDVDRISYHREYLKEMLHAIHEYNCTVLGYTAWSALDTFEWGAGYRWKFGLIHVNFSSPERTRTLKSSAYFFKSLIENKTIT